MKVFNCIFGILAIIGAIYSIFYPGITFLNSGWIVAILLGVWGICAIFDYASKRKQANKSKSEAVMGILSLIGGIVAAVISVFAIFIPSVRIILDIIILYMLSGWFIISGITSIVDSLNAGKANSKSWILTMICGILISLAGFYGIFHLIFIAQTIGFIIGILLMVYGVRLIISVFEII